MITPATMQTVTTRTISMGVIDSSSFIQATETSIASAPEPSSSTISSSGGTSGGGGDAAGTSELVLNLLALPDEEKQTFALFSRCNAEAARHLRQTRTRLIQALSTERRQLWLRTSAHTFPEPERCEHDGGDDGGGPDSKKRRVGDAPDIAVNS